MIEWIAVYDATTGQCFYIPARELGSGKAMLHLRLTPARNGQQGEDPVGERLYDDLTRAYHLRGGAIAQLAERSVCIRKVAGSNPAGSTLVVERSQPPFSERP